MMASRRCLARADYTVGWISALPIELAAAAKVLDEEHHALPQDPLDTNTYTFGTIGGHNVVMACLPVGRTGTDSCAQTATQMRSQFTSIRFYLLVGVGGGVPNNGVRLGDVTVSQPNLGRGGVVQYDFGKSTPSGFKNTGFLNAPPDILLSTLAKLQAQHFSKQSSFSTQSFEIDPDKSILLAEAPDASDFLFESTYNHEGGPTCEDCNKEHLMDQHFHQERKAMVHYGTIASGNRVIRDGVTRDELSSNLGGVLCFEMEAAGMMKSFPCLVIRGICDYADSHKNKEWQPHAASMAAAYTKQLLLLVPRAQAMPNALTIRSSRKLAAFSNRNRAAVLEQPQMDLTEEGRLRVIE